MNASLRIGAVVLLASLILAGACPPGLASPFPTLEAIEKAYIAQDAAAHPVGATAEGLHAGDARVDDVSAAAHRASIVRLHGTLNLLARLNLAGLSRQQIDDRDVLAAEIGGQLLEEERIQSWRHNPDSYVGLATQAPYSLISRNFAPAPQRMNSAIARERQLPALFAAAKQNLTNMPAVFIEIGLENLAGAIDFLQKDVPAAFAGVGNATTQAQLAESTEAAVKAARDFRAWLVSQQKTARGSFVLGSTTFAGLLAADMIDLTPDKVLAAGEAQLQRDRQDFDAVSRIVSPKNPAGALALIGRDHPDAAQLIPDAQATLAGIRDFIKTKKIVDLPSPELPKAVNTPPFQRAMIFAAMDWPGPFERNATQAFYYITPPDAGKLPSAQAEYLAYFNRPFLINLSVHEALPGHFTQFLFRRANPGWSLVRQTAGSYTATEGWAHYSEQMMQEQGVGGGGPALHLAQLSDALLRDCRLVAAVRMHTRDMSLADATNLMEKQCFQPRDVAYKEARRGTADAGYFSYTLGKLMIEKLRADVQTEEGTHFSLANFHDRFLSAGLVPIKIIRREILGRDGALL